MYLFCNIHIKTHPYAVCGSFFYREMNIGYPSMSWVVHKIGTLILHKKITSEKKILRVIFGLDHDLNDPSGHQRLLYTSLFTALSSFSTAMILNLFDALIFNKNYNNIFHSYRKKTYSKWCKSRYHQYMKTFDLKYDIH